MMETIEKTIIALLLIIIIASSCKKPDLIVPSDRTIDLVGKYKGIFTEDGEVEGDININIRVVSGADIDIAVNLFYTTNSEIQPVTYGFLGFITPNRQLAILPVVDLSINMTIVESIMKISFSSEGTIEFDLAQVHSNLNGDVVQSNQLYGTLWKE